MTQTGKLDVDFRSPSFKKATNTSFTNMFNPTVPACFEITFPKPFASVPTVALSITGLHLYGESGTHFTVNPIDVTSTTFKIELTPQSGNNALGATITWLATDA